KIKRIEELLKANGRKRSDVHLAVSPYTNPVTTDDLKRYRDAGVEEVALLPGRPGTEREMDTRLEQMAREFVEPAATRGPMPICRTPVSLASWFHLVLTSPSPKLRFSRVRSFPEHVSSPGSAASI